MIAPTHTAFASGHTTQKMLPTGLYRSVCYGVLCVLLPFSGSLYAFYVVASFAILHNLQPSKENLFQVHLIQYKLTILCFLVTDVLKLSVPFFQVTLHPTYSYSLSLWRV